MLYKVLHITYAILHSAVQCRDAAGRDGSRGERGGKEKRKQDAQIVHIEHYMRLEGNTHMHTCPVLDACWETVSEWRGAAHVWCQRCHESWFQRWPGCRQVPEGCNDFVPLAGSCIFDYFMSVNIDGRHSCQVLPSLCYKLLSGSFQWVVG